MEVLLRESGKYDTLTHLEKIMEPQDTPTRQAMQQAPMLQPDPLRLDLSTPHTSSPTTTCSLMKSYEEAIAQASFVPEDMRCRYKTGRCPLARATKRSGRPLLLCEYHRLKQNSIKRKSDTKTTSRTTTATTDNTQDDMDTATTGAPTFALVLLHAPDTSTSGTYIKYSHGIDCTRRNRHA
ncbi:hypothetical protein AC1031_009715 [Aphanomyces cochlioides]|nr:hypothetical protein AC1031_009715 [Aphanomyces cochlioides]